MFTIKYSFWMLFLVFMCILSALGEEIHCVFQHGLNPYSIPEKDDQKVFYYTKETINDLAAPLAYYWGDIVKKWTLEGDHPCTTYAFTYLDTMNKKYTDKGNSTAACDALYMDKNKTKPNRTKVFLHSMGNLIFYNALAGGYCTINKERTNVYSLAGPFGGAPIVEALDEVCAELKKISQCGLVKKLKSGIASFFNCFPHFAPFTYLAHKFNIFFKHEEKMVAVAESFCKNGRAAPGVASCNKPDTWKIKSIHDAARKYGSGVLCGTSSDGNDLYEALHFLTTRYDTRRTKRFDNDGVVPLESCQSPWVTNGKVYRERSLYNVKTIPYNHSDLTGARGHKVIQNWLIQRD